MNEFTSNICKNCGSVKFNTWNQLTEDERFIVERLPNTAEYSTDEIKKHRFCKRCLYLFKDETIDA